MKIHRNSLALSLYLIEWYFSEGLISMFALTYVALCFCGEVKPPHHFTDNARIVEGCRNEASDLRYLQTMIYHVHQGVPLSIDWYLITEDVDLAKVMECAVRSNEMNNYEGIIKELFLSYNGIDKDLIADEVMGLYMKHKLIDVNQNNCLEKGRELCKVEEKRLKSFFGI